MDGTFQHRGISEVEAEAFLFQQFTCRFCLTHAFLGQIDIVPTGESVFVVPLAFAVTDQYQLSYSHSLTPQYNTPSFALWLSGRPVHPARIVSYVLRDSLSGRIDTTRMLRCMRLLIDNYSHYIAVICLTATLIPNHSENSGSV
jgi:hypothetical protein